MNTITLHEHNGTAREGSFRSIEQRGAATIGLTTLSVGGETFSVPTVVYNDGTVISARDWQAPRMDDHEIVAEASDPMWAHHWIGPAGEPVVILAGLPRLLF